MLAVISDLHGNLSALGAVLADIDSHRTPSVDHIVCLGDVANFGPHPRETLRRVQALGCPVVMGNTDAYLLHPRTLADVQQPDENTLYFLDVERWCAEQLTDADRAFVGTFGATERLEVAGISLLCFHGSPRSYHDVIVATTPDDALAEFFQERAPLMLGGHTHAQLLRRFQDLTFINPGSVGLPYENLAGGRVRNPPWAEYALIERLRGQPSVTFRRVPYDIRPLLGAVKTSGMPHAERWSADWSDESAL